MEHSAPPLVDHSPPDPDRRRAGPAARRSRKLVAPTLATALIALLAPISASASAPPPARGGPPAAQGPCEQDDGWTATATKIDPEDSHHAFVGNGYLGQRVPPNGAGLRGPRR